MTCGAVALSLKHRARVREAAGCALREALVSSLPGNLRSRRSAAATRWTRTVGGPSVRTRRYPAVLGTGATVSCSTAATSSIASGILSGHSILISSGITMTLTMILTCPPETMEPGRANLGQGVSRAAVVV